MMLRLLSSLLGLLLAAPAVAAPVQNEHVEAELVAEKTGWVPGTPNWVALRLKPEAGWHVYWRNPGDSGLPTTLDWTLPDGWTAGEIHWPYPGAHKLGDLVNYGYDAETLHLVPLEVPAQAAGRPTIRAIAKYLVCKDICIPGKAELELALPVSTIATSDPAWSAAFEDARARLPVGPPLAGVFAIADGELRLEVAAAEALAGATQVEFFAYANNLVNHGSAQRHAIEAGRARFAQAQSAYLPALPADVTGVLVVHGGGVKAYEIRALPGEVAPLPAAPVAATAPAPATAGPATPAAPPNLPLVLAFAVLGGLILNLMPCVFPVLAIKAVSVLESRRGDGAAERRHALAYAAGAIGSCVAVAVALVAVRGGGELLGWGFQLQSPVFVAFLAYLMLALGLSLSGVVQFGTRLMGVGQGLAEQGGYAGSFFTGVLAVVVASPCTAPFMGVALGYALVQPPLVAVLVFATLGLGLALPFLLLGFFPALATALPRPGAWMETFKQAMAFPLYFTVVWLLWVLGRQTSMDGAALAMAGLVLVAFALWLWGRAPRARWHAALAVAGALLALALLAHPAFEVRAAGTPVAADAGREAYSDARLEALRGQQRAVFVNFTADWCITCKVNEKVVFSSDAVRARLAEKKVAYLVADWTTSDPAITAALARFGRSGVPLYLLYPPGGEPQVLPQILTPDNFLAALETLP